MQPRGRVTLLIVDDDDIDRRALRRAFARLDGALPIVEAGNGEEALQILHEAVERGAPGSYLVLLDLNMPRLDGHEFLEQLRADPRLAPTVVFVLTTSRRDSDVARAWGKNVAGYLTKQEIGESFARKVELLDLYARTVEFPPPPA